MAEAIGTQQEEHHLAAGFAYATPAVIAAIILVAWPRHASAPAALMTSIDLGFLAGCAFYRARFGSDSLPDRIERVRRMVTYATGLWLTLMVVAGIVIGVGKHF